MDIANIGVMGFLIALALGGLIGLILFVRSVINWRKVETEVLPDVDEFDVEEDQLPDIELEEYSNFSGANEKLNTNTENADAKFLINELNDQKEATLMRRNRKNLRK